MKKAKPRSGNGSGRALRLLAVWLPAGGKNQHLVSSRPLLTDVDAERPAAAPFGPAWRPASPGRPLEETTRAALEPRFGHTFSQVRVFDDDDAAASARSVNAQAYTVRSDIVFRPGMYAPGSYAGLRLSPMSSPTSSSSTARQRRARSSRERPTRPSRRPTQADLVVSGRAPRALSAVPAGTVQRQFGDVKVAELKAEVFASLTLDYAKGQQAQPQARHGTACLGDKLATVSGGRSRTRRHSVRPVTTTRSPTLSPDQFDLGVSGERPRRGRRPGHVVAHGRPRRGDGGHSDGGRRTVLRGDRGSTRTRSPAGDRPGLR